MTRTLLLTITAIGLAPALFVALANLAGDAISWLYRPMSLSFRLYRPEHPGESLDFLPALTFSTSTSLLIIIGSVLLLLGVSRIKPETARSSPFPPPASLK